MDEISELLQILLKQKIICSLGSMVLNLLCFSVMSVKTGIQCEKSILDSRFRGNDEVGEFLKILLKQKNRFIKFKTRLLTIY